MARRSTLSLNIGHRTDRGLVRDENEDAYIADPRLGIYCVIDGMGGHAGGRLAASIASREILSRMRVCDKDPETRVREAIALANRAILQERERRPEYGEMACVLTLAVIEGNRVTVGHVGDTRLYKIAGRTLAPVTRDHSPVGMLVHNHKLTEVQAMKHPNRNLVSRDVGSSDRQPFAADFIDVHSFVLEPDAALLLASDGLFDQVTPDAISAAVRRHAADPQEAVDVLIHLSNQAGGKDNVTAVLVCGPRFAESNEIAGDEITERLSFEDNTAPPPQRRGILPAIVALAAAALVGMLVWNPFAKPELPVQSTIYVDSEITSVDANHFRSLADAIQSAPAGSVIRVLNGRFAGPFTLRAGLQLMAAPGRDVTLFIEGASPAVIMADGLLEPTVVDGFHIAATGAQTAIDAQGSWVVLKNNKISGAADAAVRASGGSTIEMSGNRVEAGPGTVGVAVSGSSLEARTNRFILAAGTLPARAVAIETLQGENRVTLEDNDLVNCAADCVVGVEAWRQKNRVQPAVALLPPRSRKRTGGPQ